jgi:hypothetical protein
MLSMRSHWSITSNHIVVQFHTGRDDDILGLHKASIKRLPEDEPLCGYPDVILCGHPAEWQSGAATDRNCKHQNIVVFEVIRCLLIFGSLVSFWRPAPHNGKYRTELVLKRRCWCLGCSLESTLLPFILPERVLLLLLSLCLRRDCFIGLSVSSSSSC